MFINLERGKLKLYDFKIYKGIDKIKMNLVLDSQKEHFKINSTHFSYHENEIIDEKMMVRNIYYTNTGEYRRYNDFYLESESIWQYDYDLFHLTQIYLILNDLNKDDYLKLEVLNKYINGEFQSNDQFLFEKYRDKILNNIKLIELISEDYIQSEILYNLILKNSKGNLKRNMGNLKKYLNIYEMNIDSIPKIVKIK